MIDLFIIIHHTVHTDCTTGFMSVSVAITEGLHLSRCNVQGCGAVSCSSLTQEQLNELIFILLCNINMWRAARKHVVQLNLFLQRFDLTCVFCIILLCLLFSFLEGPLLQEGVERR